MSLNPPRIGLMLTTGAVAALAAVPALASDNEAADAPATPPAEIVITAAAATSIDSAAPEAIAAAASAAAADGAGDGAWTPLGSEPLGKELFAKWIPVPNGESGAPRQGWLGTADGFFTREAHLAYTYIDANGDDFHQGLARFNFPFSRRLGRDLKCRSIRILAGIRISAISR
jgi:hypothetical protein